MIEFGEEGLVGDYLVDLWVALGEPAVELDEEQRLLAAGGSFIADLIETEDLQLTFGTPILSFKK